MRILHFADLQLGVETYGRPNGKTGLNTRVEDFLRVLDTVIDHALGCGVDLVLFCGDAFEYKTPTMTVQREFASRVKRLSDGGVPTILVVGNHDLPAAMGKAHTVEIFRTLDVPGVIIADKPGTHIVETKSGPAQVVTIPWPLTSHLLTREDVKGMNPEEINELIADVIGKCIKEEAAKLNPDHVSILAAHLAVFGGSYGSQRSVMLGSEVVLPLDSVSLPQFDYVALGHLHRYQVLKDSPPVIYSGSLERVDFGEETEEKGFIVVDIDSSTQIQFVPLNARRFLTIDVSVEGADPTAQVLEEIGKHNLEETVIRLIIRGDEETALGLREGEIQQALAGAHYVAPIIKDTRRTTRLRLGDRPYEEMTPLELLETYLQSIGTVPERIEVLARAAEELMAA